MLAGENDLPSALVIEATILADLATSETVRWTVTTVLRIVAIVVTVARYKQE